MTTQELRELDAWIAEHVMGWKKSQHNYWWRGNEIIQPDQIPQFTSKPSAAMDVLKKCAETNNSICIEKHSLTWWVATRSDAVEAHNQSLETAICLFAKQLFSKTTK